MADPSITIVIDTREQEPYSFEAGSIETVRHALPAGDYSIEGYDFDLSVERKSLDDYVQTVIRERERFRKELRALQEYRDACIVVEGSLPDVVSGLYKSGASASSVFGATTSIVVDYGIPVYFCGNRQVARRFTEDWLCRWWRRLKREGAL